MFLKRIHLYQFRGFHEFEIFFDNEKGQIRKQTLFLGQNGTGKSNILKAIALITSGSETFLHLMNNPDDWVMYGKKEALIEATLVTKKNEERNISFKIVRGAKPHDLLKINDSAISQLDEALEHTSRNYFVAGYGASRRYNRSAEFVSSKERFSLTDRSASVFTLFNPDAQLNSLTSWAMALDYRSSGTNINVIKNTLNYFLEGYRFYKIDKENKTLLFKEGENVLKLESLSDGYQNMAAWIGDLLFRVTEKFKDYKSPLSARGVLLIDEIDLHLHPRWQRKLLSFIHDKLKNMQVIATTHSPLTAQQADEGELFGLRKNNGVVELVPFMGSPKTMLVADMLMSPVFGIETDESLEVQQMKAEVKKLKKKSVKKAVDKKRLGVLKSKLKELPPRTSLPVNADKHIQLLQKIESKLK